MLLGGTTAVALFTAMAYLRADTSLRFELAGSVLVLLFGAGALAGFGAVSLTIARSTATAVALGLGLTLLFVVFTYRPAVTCSGGGVSEGMPLSWVLAGAGGGTQMSRGGGDPRGMTGTTIVGGRALEYRCEGDRVVEYRESSRYGESKTRTADRPHMDPVVAPFAADEDLATVRRVLHGIVHESGHRAPRAGGARRRARVRTARG